MFGSQKSEVLKKKYEFFNEYLHVIMINVNCLKLMQNFMFEKKKKNL